MAAKNTRFLFLGDQALDEVIFKNSLNQIALDNPSFNFVVSRLIRRVSDFWQHRSSYRWRLLPKHEKLA
jgi:hypothetical protein